MLVTSFLAEVHKAKQLAPAWIGMKTDECGICLNVHAILGFVLDHLEQQPECCSLVAQSGVGTRGGWIPRRVLKCFEDAPGIAFPGRPRVNPRDEAVEDRLARHGKPPYISRLFK